MRYNFISFFKYTMLLILLTKYPTPWKVKTRLGKDIWMEKSAAFQKKCLEKLITTHRSNWRYKFLVGVSWEEDTQRFYETFGLSEHEVFTQCWSDLWQIISHALAYWHSISRTVCIIGSDVPLISTDHVYHSLRKLDHHDIVLGPSDDGGYYLIGSTRSLDEIVLWMTYSTSTVCEETLNLAKQYGYSTAIQHSMIDIDDVVALESAIQEDKTWWIQKVTQELKIDVSKCICS